MELLEQNIYAFVILKTISKLLSTEHEHFIFPPAMYEVAHFPFFSLFLSYTMQPIFANLIGDKQYAVALIYIFIINKIVHLFI